MSAPAIIPLCSHIRTNGAQCQSPALKDQPLCFYHRKLALSHRRPLVVHPLTSTSQESAIDDETLHGQEDEFAVFRAYPGQDDIEFPPLEDADSVQLASSILFHAIATGQIHFKRARILIQILKIASSNQRVIALSRAAETAAALRRPTPPAPDPAPPSAPDPSTPHPSPAEPASPSQPAAALPQYRFIQPRYHPDVITPLGFKESPTGGLYPLNYTP